MKNTFSLEQTFKTRNLDANLISCQYKLKVLAQLMVLKSLNPTLTQSELAKKIRYVKFYSTTV